jgi:hypothetical protein
MHATCLDDGRTKPAVLFPAAVRGEALRELGFPTIAVGSHFAWSNPPRRRLQSALSHLAARSEPASPKVYNVAHAGQDDRGIRGRDC